MFSSNSLLSKPSTLSKPSILPSSANHPLLRKLFILMRQANKNTDKPFLDKFQGRANKVNKAGLHSTLLNPPSQIQPPSSPDQHLRKIDLDSLIPSNPEKATQAQLIKRTHTFAKPPLKSPQAYTPTPLTPAHHSKEDASHPPSRSSFNSSNNSRGKYVFGKYLKLDKEAMEHIEYLRSLEEKFIFKRSIESSQID